MEYHKSFGLLLLLSITPIFAYKEITGLLEQHSNELTREELNALRPLFEKLQQQYDYIANETTKDGHNDDEATDPQFLAMYKSTQHEFEQYFAELLQRQHESSKSNEKQTGIYDTTLPSVTELMGPPAKNLSSEALAERADIESILQDVLNEAQSEIDNIVRQALSMESQFIKINKPKIVKAIFEALGILFQIAVRVSRAAYCTYSHIPQLNETLHHIYDGVDCYSYTTALVLRIQGETVQAVSTIKKNVYNLADVYKKIADKHSILGKLSAMLLNVLKIQRNIKEAVTVALNSLNLLQHEMPVAAQEVVNCGLSFADDVPQMIETVANVSTCILFVDNTTQRYDFMEPMGQHDFNDTNQFDDIDDVN